MGTQVLLVAVLVLVAVAVALLLVMLLRPTPQERVHSELSQTRSDLTSAAQRLTEQLGRVHVELTRLIDGLGDTSQTSLATTQRAAEAIERVERVLLGAGTKGAAGENILAQMLRPLAPDFIETNARLRGGMVEFALRLSDGRLIPVDSKWTATRLLEEFLSTEDGEKQQDLARQIERAALGKAREVAEKYLDPERTIGLGVVAVPDAVFNACLNALTRAYREHRVIIIPYSQALPYLLSLLHVVNRFASTVDAARLSGALQTLAEALGKMQNEMEGRFADALTRLENARRDLNSQLVKARQALAQAQATAPPQEAVVVEQSEGDVLQ